MEKRRARAMHGEEIENTTNKNQGIVSELKTLLTTFVEASKDD